jgi:hypothetical protein
MRRRLVYSDVNLISFSMFLWTVCLAMRTLCLWNFLLTHGSNCMYVAIFSYVNFMYLLVFWLWCLLIVSILCLFSSGTVLFGWHLLFTSCGSKIMMLWCLCVFHITEIFFRFFSGWCVMRLWYSSTQWNVITSGNNNLHVLSSSTMIVVDWWE